MSEQKASKSTATSKSRSKSGAAGSSSKRPVTFPYIAPGPNWHLTPIVPVTVVGPNGEPFQTYGVIDSGADSSALPISVAPTLGINLKKDCKRSDDGMSAGGGGQTQFVFNPGLDAEVFGHPFPMIAVFMATPFILLGQEDFFRAFHVSFDRREETFTIRPF